MAFWTPHLKILDKSAPVFTTVCACGISDTESQAIESEIHVLTKCNLYIDLGTDYLIEPHV